MQSCPGDLALFKISRIGRDKLIITNRNKKKKILSMLEIYLKVFFANSYFIISHMYVDHWDLLRRSEFIPCNDLFMRIASFIRTGRGSIMLVLKSIPCY
jgi:hypothetical protein